MKYPAPYSQSWANTEPVKMGIDKMKHCGFSQENTKNQNLPNCNCCWKRPNNHNHGSNPFAPHLKYGLFPKKVILKQPSLKPSIDKKIFTLEDLTHMSMDKFIKDRRKGIKKERRSSDAPVLTIRPVDKSHTRELSMSEMTHLDIKPRHNLPIQRTMSPRSRVLTSKR